MSAYLYMLVDPAYPRWPRYVGVTINVEQRQRVHSVRRHTVNPALRGWKSMLLDAGLPPRLLVLAEFATIEEALEREWRVIQRWKRRGLCDLNLAPASAKPYALMCAAKRENQGATEAQKRTRPAQSSDRGGFTEGVLVSQLNRLTAIRE